MTGPPPPSEDILADDIASHEMLSSHDPGRELGVGATIGRATTLAELAEQMTDLDSPAVNHLQRLVGSWAAMADLSLSDLVLMATVRGSESSQLVAIGQIRPTTSSTVVTSDLVGHVVDALDWPLAIAALRRGHNTVGVGPVPVAASPASALGQLEVDSSSSSSGIPEGDGHEARAGVAVPISAFTGEVPAVPEQVRIECIPVSLGGYRIAVLVRLSSLETRRRVGRLEQVYRSLFYRLADMVVVGEYPFPGDDLSGVENPRVGDGLILVDAEGSVIYASPNATGALHRMGVRAPISGRHLSASGIDASAVDRALGTGRPVIEEVERQPDVSVVLHCTPLLSSGTVTGAMVLVRDVTDLRRLDRLLLSKDAAIREVHHRVKNNLQTISSLLRLQARRLVDSEAQQALHEAERRVRSIAVVHEILSREPGDQVPFADIASSLVRMAEDSSVSGRDVDIQIRGDLGEVPAAVATPLAVVVAELLQNAVEHAFGHPDDDHLRATDAESAHHVDPKSPTAGQLRDVDARGHVEVALVNDGRRLSVQVTDDGCGLPEGFDIEKTTSLGLSIVRDLVTSQLGGAIAMDSSEGCGTRVSVDLPTGYLDQS